MINSKRFFIVLTETTCSGLKAQPQLCFAGMSYEWIDRQKMDNRKMDKQLYFCYIMKVTAKLND